MKRFLQIAYDDGSLAGWICLLISASLILSSFILPPLGIIDNSVLAAVGELFAFGTLFKLPAMVKSIKEGLHIKVLHGETSIEVSKDCDDTNHSEI